MDGEAEDQDGWQVSVHARERFCAEGMVGLLPVEACMYVYELGKLTAPKRNDLSIHERKEYIDAVLCLQKLPSKAVNVPGTKNRFDDFVATHMTQVNTIHWPAC